MSQFTVGQLNVDIAARLTRLESGLNRAKTMVSQSGQQMETRLSRAGERLDRFVADLTKAAGIAAVLAGAFDAITASIKIARGDVEGFKQSLRSIPLLGQFVTRGEAFSQALFGVQQRRAFEQQRFDELNRVTVGRLSLFQRQQQESAAARTGLGGLHQERALLAVSGARREARSLRFDIENRMAELQTRLASAQSSQARSAIINQMDVLQTIGVQRRQALIRDLSRRARGIQDGGQFGVQIDPRFQVLGGPGTRRVQTEEARLLKEIKDAILELFNINNLKPATEFN